MKTNKTTLKIQATFNYQVASMEVEIEDYTEQELAEYFEYLSDICSDKVKGISERIGSAHSTTEKPKVQATRTPYYQQNNQYNNNPPANPNARCS